MERRAAAADARLGRATGLASLGDAEDAEDDELLASQKELAANQNDQEDDREATLGLVAAEPLLYTHPPPPTTSTVDAHDYHAAISTT